MRVIKIAYLTDGPFGINFKVHSTCEPQDDADLIVQDGLRSVPCIFLVCIIYNNGRDDGAA